ARAVAAVQRVLMDAGALFGTESDSLRDWHRRVLRLRVAAARQSIPQIRLLISSLMSDEVPRRKVVEIWKGTGLAPPVASVKRFQARGELRSDLAPEKLARAIISLNLGYIFASALLAPEAPWDDEAEIEATVELLARGAAG